MKTMNNPLLLFAFLSLALTSCLESTSSSTHTSSTVIPATDFAGATSAENLGGSIKVTWTAATSNTNIVQYNVYRMLSGKMILQMVMQPNQNEFIDGAVIAGQFYEYIVRAVDHKGLEDSNTKKVRAFSYPGLMSAVPNTDTKGQVRLTFANASVASKIRIYARRVHGGTATSLIAELDPHLTTYDVPPLSSASPLGLRTGTTYELFARAYFNTTDSDDGNSVKLVVQTASDAFTSDSTQLPSGYRFKGFSSVQAFGLSPGAPQAAGDTYAMPRTRQVWLRWLDYDGDPASKYKVVRVRSGDSINLATTVPCTSTQTSSCVVCDNVANTMTARMCKDTQVDAPPAKYDYVVGYYKTQHDQFFLEELPVQNEDVRLKVHIPPDDMVLVQRAAVNYEMCTMMGLSIDPKKQNRCLFSGPGDFPLNSGPNRPNLNLENGYYDFGHNLFVDRYEVGCKWTKTTSSYTACGSPHGCIGMSTPATSLGQNGDVYLALYPTNARITTAPDTTASGTFAWNTAGTGPWGNNAGPAFPTCLIKNNGTWRTFNFHTTSDTTGTVEVLADQLVKQMVTIDPREKTVPLLPISRNTINTPLWPACSAQIDPNYGPKRMPRLREFRAYAGAITDTEDLASYNIPSAAASLGTQNGLTHANTGSFGGYGCNTNVLNMKNVPAFPANATGDDMPSNWSTMLAANQSLGWNTVAHNQVIGDTSNYATGRFNSSPHFKAFIGSIATSHCISRFGVQDTLGNAQELISESMGSCQGSAGSPAQQCVGAPNPADPDKGDFMNYVWDGTAIFRGTLSFEAAQLTNSKWGTYLNIPLGLPVLLRTGVWTQSTLKSALTAILSTSNFTMSNLNTTASKPIYVGGGASDGNNSSRFMTTFTNNGGGNDGFRCVLPAE